MKDTSVVTPVGLITVLFALAAGYQAITRGPAYVMALVALAVCVTLRTLAVRNGRQMIARRAASIADEDPWARPSRRDRKLQRRSLNLSLSLTELNGLFPSISMRSERICASLGYA